MKAMLEMSNSRVATNSLYTSAQSIMGEPLNPPWASWNKSFPQVNVAVRQSSYQTLQCWSITHIVTLGCLPVGISLDILHIFTNFVG